VVRTVLVAPPMRRLGVGIGLALTIAGGLLACGASRLPAPAYVGQPTEALAQVDYPPPPARVEQVPETPKDDAVWVDGEWTWQGRRWAWKQGRWLLPPANAKFSPWTSTRDSSGNLFVAEGKWRDPKGNELPDPEPLATARTRAGGVVSPEGEEVPPAPNARPTPPGSRGTGTEHMGPQTPSGATPTGTEPKTGPVIDSGAPPVDGAIPDAGPFDAEPDALPLGARTSQRVSPSVRTRMPT